MECAEPGHAFHGRADEETYALPHFACGLIGKGDGEDLVGECPLGCEDMGEARGQHPGLAGSSTRQDKQ
jgi:hypothetical protein